MSRRKDVASGFASLRALHGKLLVCAALAIVGGVVGLTQASTSLGFMLAAMGCTAGVFFFVIVAASHYVSRAHPVLAASVNLPGERAI